MNVIANGYLDGLMPRPYLILSPVCASFLMVSPPESADASWKYAERLLENTDIFGAPVRRQTLAEWCGACGALPNGFRPEQGYVLDIQADGVQIAADTAAGARNALHTLAQLVFLCPEPGRLPVLKVIDWPCIAQRCAHICYHLSQPWMPLSFPDFSALLGLIRRLAHFKFNAVVLELESMYPFRLHPEVATPYAFVIDQIAELSRTCRGLGLEVIPLLQCLGHAYHVLRLPCHAHLRETPDSLQQYCPSNPGTRNLFLELAQELCAAFSARRFHIGGDESRRLGICPECSRTTMLEGVGALYGKHVGAVARSLLEGGITPLAWGDMVEHHSPALGHLPPELELVHWKYSMRAPGRVMDFWQFGAHPVWAASGVRSGSCNQTMYRFQDALQGVACLAAEARRAGCDRWMITDWMKAVPFELSEIGQAYAAEAGWQGVRSMDEFTAAYTRVIHGAALPQFWRVYAAMEPTLPYAEDAQARRHDFLDRHDYSGLPLRQRIEKYTATVERDKICRQLRAGLAGAQTARRIMDDMESAIIRRRHVWEVLSLSVDNHAHKARLGLAVDEAVRLLKYPLPDASKLRESLAKRFEQLAEEHAALRARAADVLARETLAPNREALARMMFDPAERAWMFYFAGALRSGRYLPMLFGEEQSTENIKMEAY